MRVTLRQILKDKSKDWRLALVAGEKGLDREVAKPDLHRPGMFFVGYREFFPARRLQIIGQTEISFLASCPPDRRRSLLADFYATRVPGVFITRGLLPPGELIEESEKSGVSTISTSMTTNRFIHLLSDYLGYALAPSKAVHGTLVELFGVGVLITGKPGVGKSECALSLVRRGHSLVADDALKIIGYPDGHLQGTSGGPRELAGFMEIRGVGIVDIRSMFGKGAIKDVKEVDMIVELVDRGHGVEASSTEILGVHLPLFRYPVAPGRDIATILEVLALDYSMKREGRASAEAFSSRLRRLLGGE